MLGLVERGEPRQEPETEAMAETVAMADQLASSNNMLTPQLVMVALEVPVEPRGARAMVAMAVKVAMAGMQGRLVTRLTQLVVRGASVGQEVHPCAEALRVMVAPAAVEAQPSSSLHNLQMQ